MGRRTKRGLFGVIGGSAVRGFGASIGRDTWRAAKNNPVLFALLALTTAVVMLPFTVGRDRGPASPQDKRVTSGILLIAAGVLLTLMLARSRLHLGPLAVPLLILAAVVVVMAVLYGWSRKTRGKAEIGVEEHNEQFLRQFGFQYIGETEITHMDGDGNPLRLVEQTDDSLVFQAVGRRNRRAYISISPEGRMLGYTGVIALTDQRQYRDPSGVSLR